MTTIEKKAKEFVDAPCGWLCANCASDKMSCRFYNDKESFKAGAEWMREELTRWNDPKEKLPERNKTVLLKTDDDLDVYSVGYFNGRWFGGNIPAMAEVIGWREIHEG